MRIYAAPAASLLAVTAVVLAVHYGLQHHAKVVATVPVVHPAKAVVHRRRPPALAQTYVVQRGDSFSTIALKTHTTVARLERLNPGLSPTALRVGQIVKVK